LALIAVATLMQITTLANMVFKKTQRPNSDSWQESYELTTSDRVSDTHQ